MPLVVIIAHVPKHKISAKHTKHTHATELWGLHMYHNREGLVVLQPYMALTNQFVNPLTVFHPQYHIINVCKTLKLDKLNTPSKTRSNERKINLCLWNVNPGRKSGIGKQVPMVSLTPPRHCGQLHNVQRLYEIVDRQSRILSLPSLTKLTHHLVTAAVHQNSIGKSTRRKSKHYRMSPW